MEDNALRIEREGSRPAAGHFILAGWLCLLVAVVWVVVSLTGLFFAIPLMVAAFVLSIIAMARHRIVAGVILLVSTMVLGPAGLLIATAMHVGQQFQASTNEKSLALEHVEFEDLNGYLDGNFMYCKGKIRNRNSSPISYVKVQVEWLDKAGLILDTDYTYAVAGEELSPGAAKSFEMMSPADHRMKSYRCRVLPA